MVMCTVDYNRRGYVIEVLVTLFLHEICCSAQALLMAYSKCIAFMCSSYSYVYIGLQ